MLTGGIQSSSFPTGRWIEDDSFDENWKLSYGVSFSGWMDGFWKVVFSKISDYDKDMSRFQHTHVFHMKEHTHKEENLFSK